MASIIFKEQRKHLENDERIVELVARENHDRAQLSVKEYRLSPNSGHSNGPSNAQTDIGSHTDLALTT